MRTIKPPAVGLVLALSLLPALASAQPSQLAGFDVYVRKGVTDWHVPGLSVAVVKDGHVVFARGYGVREAVSPETWMSGRSSRSDRRPRAMTAAPVGMARGRAEP